MCIISWYQLLSNRSNMVRCQFLALYVFWTNTYFFSLIFNTSDWVVQIFCWSTNNFFPKLLYSCIVNWVSSMKYVVFLIGLGFNTTFLHCMTNYTIILKMTMKTLGSVTEVLFSQFIVFILSRCRKQFFW